MAGIVLDRVWLHLADTPATFETFYSTKPGNPRSKAGEVRAYAGGRLRTVTRKTRRQTVSVRALDLTAAQVETLDGWQSETLLYRDGDGLLLIGTFFDLDPEPYPFGQGFEAAFTFQQVTSSLPAV